MQGPDTSVLSPAACVTLLGHSHVAAIARAAERHGTSLRVVNLWLHHLPVAYAPEGVRIAPEIEPLLGEVVVSTVGGSAQDMLGLCRHPQPFDFVLPSAPDLPLEPGAELVPVAAVSDALRALVQREFFEFVALLGRSGRRVIHLEPPPPVGEDERLAREMAFLGFVSPANAVPAPPWLRYKLWRLHTEILRAEYEPAGVVVLPAPVASQDAQGFLRPEFYAYACHANVDYGVLVLRQLGLIV